MASNVVRTEDELGPNLDKHALIVNNFREVHEGSWSAECTACREAKRLINKEGE